MHSNPNTSLNRSEVASADDSCGDRPRVARWVHAALAIAAVAAGSLWLGQDASWDLQNYHLYNGIAWLNGRFAYDIAPAHVQTWHNPLLDLPFAWLVARQASGWWVTAWLAVPSVIALYFALRLLDPLCRTRPSFGSALAVAAIAVSGAAAWAELGTVFNDWFVAAGVLAALSWAVHATGRRSALWCWFPVGLLGGATAGLKLTAVFYCVGLVAAAIFAGTWRSAPRRLAALALGGLVGAVATYGYWGYSLWQRFGNPVFPYFNNLFRSPDAALVDFADDRFRPQSWLDFVSIPIQLLSPSRRFAESTLADPRLLLGLSAGVLWAISLWRSRPASSTQPSIAEIESQRLRLLLAFCFVSALYWAVAYGVYRYLLALELVCSMLIVIAIEHLWRWRWRGVVLVAAVAGVGLATAHPNWGRQPFRSPMLNIPFPPMAPNSLVVLATYQPVAYAVAFLPESIAAVSVYNSFFTEGEVCSRMQAHAWQAVTTHQAALYTLRPEPVEPFVSARLDMLGLKDVGECRPLDGTLAPLSLCRLQRVAPSTPLPPNVRPVRFNPEACGPPPARLGSATSG